MVRYVLAALVAVVTAVTSTAQAWGSGVADASNLPAVELVPALPIAFPAEVDSNSPAFWANGRLHVLNSLYHPYLSDGRSVGRLEDPVGVIFRTRLSAPRWMEAVIQAEDGTLYGFYHLEPRGVCENNSKTAPQIGAARSRDNGFSWDDLGIIMAAPFNDKLCDTANLYFVGGEGDFSAVLDREGQYVYFVFSAYASDKSRQGISVARMPWAYRDQPAGRVRKWWGGVWSSPGVSGRATPVYPVAASWHDAQADALWGPSIHWNAHLEMYVILMTRAGDASWTPAGIHIAYAARLDDPRTWSTPRLLVEGGAWYPQVMGIERGTGTDSHAGEYPRFFMGGRSDFFLRFERPAASPSPATPSGARAN
jgi:hypothetical protein